MSFSLVYSNLELFGRYYLLLIIRDPATQPPGVLQVAQFNNIYVEGATFEEVNDNPKTSSDQISTDYTQDIITFVFVTILVIGIITGKPIYHKYTKSKPPSKREPLQSGSKLINQKEDMKSNFLCKSCDTHNSVGSKFCMECGVTITY